MPKRDTNELHPLLLAWRSGVVNLVRTIVVATLWLISAAIAHAQVFSSEFDSLPIDEGWTLLGESCEPVVWLDNGVYVQQLNFDACPPPPNGGTQTWRSTIGDFNSSATFFLEYRAETSGDRSEIPGAAPTVVSLGNLFGINYNATMARDQIKFLRDVVEPILFFDLTPDVPHTIRLELYNDPPPATYRWFIDGAVVDEGLAEGPYPADDSRTTWHGAAWFLPTLNRWHYIRYGVIPADGSGDFHSDGAVDENDQFFFEECLDNSGVNVDAGPGCRWADFDGDTDVDCDDWDAFDAAWTGAGNPTVPAACFVPPIPAASTWGMTIMMLGVLIAGTLLVRRHRCFLLCF